MFVIKQTFLDKVFGFFRDPRTRTHLLESAELKRGLDDAIGRLSRTGKSLCSVFFIDQKLYRFQVVCDVKRTSDSGNLFRKHYVKPTFLLYKKRRSGSFRFTGIQYQYPDNLMCIEERVSFHSSTPLYKFFSRECVSTELHPPNIFHTDNLIVVGEQNNG